MSADYSAKAVIGAGFGDEGKGLTVAHLTEYDSPDYCWVVRHSGGAQAGHTVVQTIDTVDEHGEDVETELRHVFHHYGSGTLTMYPTYLARRFISNPILWGREKRDLQKLFKTIPLDYARDEEYGFQWKLPRLVADARGLVTTYVDMLINEMLEAKRQKTLEHHGSVGVGINETMVRQEYGPILSINDLLIGWHSSSSFRRDLKDWSKQRLETLGLTEADDPQRYEWLYAENIQNAWMTDCDMYAKELLIKQPSDIRKNLIFEGSQGLLLDRNHHEYWPHLTNANTGLTNVVEFINESQEHYLENVIYVTRPYMTRHGAGPFPSEDDILRFQDDTNKPGEFQGSLRFGHWDPEVVCPAIDRDKRRDNEIDSAFEYETDFNFMLTHRDQCDEAINAKVFADLINEAELNEGGSFYSIGPRTSNVHAY